MTVMRPRTLVPAVLLILAIVSGTARAQQRGAPETFTANLHVTGATGGAAAATIQIDIRRYTPEAERTAVETALKTGGYAAFVAALRKAPEVGTVSSGDQKWSIRWAREQPSAQGRRIVVVTDQPIFFVGGGRVDAKPRTGFDVALIEIQIDEVGLGSGTMAAAARVRPGGDAGVQVDDYADKPIKLVTVVRKIQ
jgi:hypothetical protein